MKFLLPLFFAGIVAVSASAQCSDGFSKLFPESTTDFSLEFGKSISMYDNYLAVGMPDSDTLSRQNGIVYIYEKKNGGWAKIASMTVASPTIDLRLGINVKLSANYLLASAEGSGGKVFIYKKPSGGWVSSTELTMLSASVSQSFGTAYHHPVDISEDENTIAITDALVPHDSNPVTMAGTLHIFHKGSGQEWSNAFVPTQIKATKDIIDFGRAGIYISGTSIITGTPFTPSGHGNLFIYNDPSGTFANLTLEALLSPAANESFWMNNIVITEDGIMGSVAGSAQLQIVFFKKPSNGIWVDAEPTLRFDPDDNSNVVNTSFIMLATNGTDVYSTTSMYIGWRNLTRFRKGNNGWGDRIVESIDHDYTISNQYGLALACNQGTDVTVGYSKHPLNSTVLNTLKVYSQPAPNTWSSTTLYAEKQSTRNHHYGTKMVVQDDWMFVSATRDNTVKADAGKVYVYHKNGVQWNKVSSIEPEARIYSDKDFGSALAANQNFLAVGAVNWLPVGRVFIYKRNGAVWDSNPYQEIEIPTAPGEEILSYGDNLAMSDKWLLIPYGNYGANPQVMVAAYEYNGTQWIYRQSVETGWYDFFDKFATVGIDIEDNTFVARGQVFELNDSNTWVNTAELSPTDPEGLRFNYPFFELITNDSKFGQTVVIKDKTVFIGAPRKDFQGIWDVGAVYIYKKSAEGPWTSRTESGKIIPQTIQESGLFGASLAPFESSIVIGAPVSEYFKNGDLNGDVKKNIPGKAMLFQARDANWTGSVLIKTYVGETSSLDNFGGQVHMDEKNIYITAPMEDISTGAVSGSLYISEKPPTVSTIPDLCNTATAHITLTAKPSGGTWSGTGIINATLGIFDPGVAGVGTHEITYTMPGCSLNVKTDITIHAKPAAILESELNQTVCAEDFYIAVPLSVQTVPNCTYQWFYRENESDEFSLLNETVTSMATQRGDYRVEVSNPACETVSDIISVRDETQELLLEPLNEVCGTQTGGRPLYASPQSGAWIGPGVVNGNKFSIDGIADGTVVLRYYYNSPRGCQYQKEMAVKIKRLAPLAIDRTGNLCEEGVVDLSLQGTPAAGTIYTWSHADENEGIYSVTGNGGSLETTLRGSYILSALTGVCATASPALVINDTFSSSLSPEMNKSEVCYGEDFQFSFPSNSNAQYEWYYSGDNQGYNLLTEVSGKLNPERSGYYYGIEKRGVCSVTSPKKYVYIHRKDSVFAANVMTPNGDRKNDTFSLYVFNGDSGQPLSPQGYISYSLFNRWGDEVFSAPMNEPWTGANAETGVYFWQGQYNACGNNPRVVKGWVHLKK